MGYVIDRESGEMFVPNEDEGRRVGLFPCKVEGNDYLGVTYEKKPFAWGATEQYPTIFNDDIKTMNNLHTYIQIGDYNYLPPDTDPRDLNEKIKHLKAVYAEMAWSPPLVLNILLHSPVILLLAVFIAKWGLATPDMVTNALVLPLITFGVSIPSFVAAFIRGVPPSIMPFYNKLFATAVFALPFGILLISSVGYVTPSLYRVLPSLTCTENASRVITGKDLRAKFSLSNVDGACLNPNDKLTPIYNKAKIRIQLLIVFIIASFAYTLMLHFTRRLHKFKRVIADLVIAGIYAGIFLLATYI